MNIYDYYVRVSEKNKNDRCRKAFVRLEKLLCRFKRVKDGT